MATLVREGFAKIGFVKPGESFCLREGLRQNDLVCYRLVAKSFKMKMKLSNVC